MAEQTLTVVNGQYLVEGIQLRPRFLVPAWFGNCVLWLFFHRLDTKTEVVITNNSSARVLDSMSQNGCTHSKGVVLANAGVGLSSRVDNIWWGKNG